jgi:hypothetical protein|eukprot:1113251-Prymnesium_polylepis.1
MRDACVEAHLAARWLGPLPLGSRRQREEEIELLGRHGLFLGFLLGVQGLLLGFLLGVQVHQRAGQLVTCTAGVHVS